MDFELFRKTVERMTKKERDVAIVLYLKDIKDLLQSFLESKKIKAKHY